MAGVAVDIGFGTSVVFGTSGFSANLLSLDIGGIAVETPESSHMGLSSPSAGTYGNREFLSGGLIDGGEVTMEFHFNPNDAVPVVGTSETVAISFPLASGDTTRANWAFTGIVSGFNPSVPMDDVMTASLTVKVTGAVTQTDSLST